MLINKIIVVSFSFIRGGAAKAANRFFMIANNLEPTCSISVDESPGKVCKSYHFIKRLVSLFFVYLYQRKAGVKCSANLFSFQPLVYSLVNHQGLAHIHWINNDTISVYDFKKIPYGSILTLHDEWMYCGIEHYFSTDEVFESSSYYVGNKSSRKGFQSYLHYHIWSIKKRSLSYRSDLVVTCPSKWLANRARHSYVLENCDVRVMYNPIDVEAFAPLDSVSLKRRRADYALEDRFLILFGAIGGTKNKLKGFAELQLALQLLSKNCFLKNKVALGLFGGQKQGIKELYGFPVREFGYIKNEQEMAEIFSTAHVTLVPSKLEAFGQVAAESQSCETPVIAFDTSGLKDVVIDGKTGFLAEPFYPESLADKIEKILCMPSEQYNQLCKYARQHVIENFSKTVISKQYEFLLKEQLLKKQEANK